MIVVCPGCRTRTAERIDVRTLERRGDILYCECGRRYPIVDGVPLVMANPAAYVRSDIAAIVERDLSPDITNLLVEDGPDDAPYPHFLEHLSIYMDAHWGDRSTPPDGFALRAIVDRIAKLPRVKHAVELGCSTGRVVAELARTADHVVGIDMKLGCVRRARRLLAGEVVTYGRRMIGRTYDTVATQASERATNTTLLAADALDPPLVHGSYDRIVALNLLDAVPHPRQLLDVIYGLAAPNAELVISTPYAWQSSVMAEHERLPGTLVDQLSERWQIVDDEDLPWTLRRDARSSVSYRVHYVRALRR